MIFMQPDAFGEERVRLIITLDELGIGGNALNEVCNGITVVDFADFVWPASPSITPMTFSGDFTKGISRNTNYGTTLALKSWLSCLILLRSNYVSMNLPGARRTCSC